MPLLRDRTFQPAQRTVLLVVGVTEYSLHDGLVSSLFAPDSTNMANVAHFMCELATDSKTWDDWKGKLPVIINAKRRER
jgi:hypothetical protein